MNIKTINLIFLSKMLHLVLFLVLLISCGSEEKSIQKDFEACSTTASLGVKVAADLVDHEELILHRLRYHYFTNEKVDTFTNDFFRKRTEILNYNFAFSNTRRKFIVQDIIKYDQTPESYEKARKVIEGIENIQPRPDLRSKFIIEQFAFWGKIFESNDAIDVFIYDNTDSGFAGVALAIQSKIIAVRWDYMDPIYVMDTKQERNTLEHEIGHALGLYHTHHEYTKQKNYGFDRNTGDKACDTPITKQDLYNYINDDGTVSVGAFPDGMPKECIINSTYNFMSYTEGWLRSLFTPDQVRIMDDALETNFDLRATSPNFDNLMLFDIPKLYETK